MAAVLGAHVTRAQQEEFYQPTMPTLVIRIVRRITVFSGEVLEIRPAFPLDSGGLSPLDQRTSIPACRAKRLIAGDRRYDLVIVPCCPGSGSFSQKRCK